MSYKNAKFVLKHKIAQKRAEAVAREIAAQYGAKINKKEQDERVLWKKNEVCFLHRKKIIRNMKWRGSEK
jgi:translocon-associated protein subunit gamma